MASTAAGWEPYRVDAVQELLTGCSARWWLSGGWAIDHALGRTTRPHGDIDVSTTADGIRPVLDTLPAELEPFVALRDALLPATDALDRPDAHNIWVRDRRSGRWVLQVNVEAGDESCWRYRRHHGVELPWERAVTQVRGVPTGTPATQLLWKSRDPRPRDDADLAAALPLLTPAERRWLRQAVTASHPASPWLRGPSRIAPELRR